MSDEPVNLFAQQDANRKRSRWLIFGFLMFFAWLGFGGDFIAYLATQGAPAEQYHHVFPWFGILMTTLGGGLARYAWKTGPDKVLWSCGAHELTDPETPEEKQLANVVDEMAIAASIPRPRLWLVDDDDPNAFACGHDAFHANIAVTRGLLTTVNRDELQAVIGHEMGHIKNLDVQLMTLLAGMVGAVALISDGMGRMMRGGVRVGGVGGRSSKSKDMGPLVVILLVLWLVSWLLAPFVTRLLAMGVSRKREFLADAMSAQFTRNPLALASALTKIEAADAPTASIKGGCAHLCIVDPLGRKMNAKEGGMSDLFGTHPPMAMRVAKLRAMGYAQQKKDGTFVPEPAA